MESLLAPSAAAQMVQGLQQQAVAGPAGQNAQPGLPAPPLGVGAQPQVQSFGAMGGQVSQGL